MAAMSPGVRDILLDGGCLTEMDVLLGREFLAARARLEGCYGQSGAVTVEEFAEACRDMKATSPTFNSINVIPGPPAPLVGAAGAPARSGGIPPGRAGLLPRVGEGGWRPWRKSMCTCSWPW